MAAPPNDQSTVSRAEKFLSELPKSPQTKNSALQNILNSTSTKIVLTLFLLLFLFAVTFFLSYITILKRQGGNNSQTSGGCAIGGCNSELCLESSQKDQIVSTCIFRPEYECYRSARCEKQGNGRCGWTQSEELKSCLVQYQ